MSKIENQNKIFFLLLFGIAMAHFEAALVVYLRELFYPEGFSLPLKLIPRKLIIIELCRELATLLMLIAVAGLAARKFWERFGYFIILFGVWDIFYYVFLKITLDWPASLFDWDILFLIPLPWLGPVIAPVLIALLMIICGFLIVRIYQKGKYFKPTAVTWVLSIMGTGIILYSFMHDTDATIRLQMPKPYDYWMLLAGLLCYLTGYLHTHRKTA